MWKLGPDDERTMERTLPVDTKDLSSSLAMKQPWLLYAMPVNSLNFCAFAMCIDGMPQPSRTMRTLKDSSNVEPILFVVPNAVEDAAVCVLVDCSDPFSRANTISDRCLSTA